MLFAGSGNQKGKPRKIYIEGKKTLAKRQQHEARNRVKSPKSDFLQDELYT
jgi:hypothetical protein